MIGRLVITAMLAVGLAATGGAATAVAQPTDTTTGTMAVDGQFANHNPLDGEGAGCPSSPVPFWSPCGWMGDL
ncbi:hypothetical protein BRC97_00955 [Halobacteriales archaeon QS_6_71_20]|nr:MAG: hypothetical protein BRC97_00955 [Halobacteriales archaeon QS_6_71_20]